VPKEGLALVHRLAGPGPQAHRPRVAYSEARTRALPLNGASPSDRSDDVRMGEQHRRPVSVGLLSLDALTIPERDMGRTGTTPVQLLAKEGLFDEGGNMGALSKRFLQTRLNQYLAWVKKHAAC
jgi:hypothetical protein